MVSVQNVIQVKRQCLAVFKNTVYPFSDTYFKDIQTLFFSNYQQWSKVTVGIHFNSPHQNRLIQHPHPHCWCCTDPSLKLSLSCTPVLNLEQQLIPNPKWTLHCFPAENNSLRLGGDNANSRHSAANQLTASLRSTLDEYKRTTQFAKCAYDRLLWVESNTHWDWLIDCTAASLELLIADKQVKTNKTKTNNNNKNKVSVLIPMSRDLQEDGHLYKLTLSSDLCNTKCPFLYMNKSGFSSFSGFCSLRVFQL